MAYVETTREDSVTIVDLEEHGPLENSYKKTVDLMRSIYKKASESFDMKGFDECIEDIVKSVNHRDAFTKLIEIISQDYTTYEHSVNVAFYVALIAQAIDLDMPSRKKLIFTALLHDIGKLRINQEILDKASFLSDQEFEKVKLHSEYGAEILASNGVDDQMILQGVLYHHERADGSGYPHRLRGKRIPKFARIIGLCDVFDALTTQRTFRESYSSFEALSYMKKEMPTQLDITLIDALIKLHR